MIDGVVIRPLRQIHDERGKIMKMVERTDEGFESFGEHPPGSGSGDLVEIEQESFVLAPDLMYPLHRCTPSRRRANVGSPFDCSKGRYTTLFRKSPIHNFRS